jgi:hypothetical protein
MGCAGVSYADVSCFQEALLQAYAASVRLGHILRSQVSVEVWLVDWSLVQLLFYNLCLGMESSGILRILMPTCHSTTSSNTNNGAKSVIKREMLQGGD